MRFSPSALAPLLLAACATAGSSPAPHAPHAPDPLPAQAIGPEPVASPDDGGQSLSTAEPTTGQRVPMLRASLRVEPPSCKDAKSCNGESCCARLGVPGGSFSMPGDGGRSPRAVEVPAFDLDKYEITVGRVRAWLVAGAPVPATGAVLLRLESGRTVTWPGTAIVQDEKRLSGWERYDTWTAGNDALPKNFLSYYTALAVCAFDGGRLPTEAEWKFAALGGDEQRSFPWGAEAPSPDLAIFNCMGDGDAACSKQDILPVGSRPRGAGRWGHMDLAGSMFEWTIDPDSAGAAESNRGGGFCYIGGVDRRAKTGLRPAVLRREPPTTVSHMTGARCAYDVSSREQPRTAAR